MEESIEITKNELKRKLNITNFDRLIRDWEISGLIDRKGKVITFPQESKNLVDRYIDFWGDFQKGGFN